MSRDSGGPCRLSWSAPYLEFLQWVRDFLKFRRKGEANFFAKHLLHYRKYVSRIICDTVYKYPLRLHHTYHLDVIFLGVFSHSFNDCMDIMLPRLCTIFQPITFGLVILYKTSKIMRTRAHLKTMTQAKPFPGFDIYGWTIKTLLEGSGKYPRPRLYCCSKLKYDSTLANIPSAPSL